MRSVLAPPIRRVRQQVVDDLRTDPYLPYILLLATVLSSFWIWHRLPNFATRDERWRVVDPIEVFAALHEEVSYESLRDGVTYWRSYGATFYVAAVALIPVVLFVVAAGRVEEFAAMGSHAGTSFWAHWLRTPGWIWTWSVLPYRLVNVVFAVGSVYVVYRIGTTMRDRATGRLAALLTTFTWGLLILVHEAGEDVPALFFFLLAFYLALRYVETGADATLYWAALAGGLGAGMKLNAGVVALVIGGAFFLRAAREEGTWRERYVRPKLLIGGAGLGLVAILASYPSVLIGAPGQLGARITRGVANKGQPHGWLVQPSWWWILRGYLHGLGLPLAVASAIGLLASPLQFREKPAARDGVALALLAIGIFLALYGRWAYVRTHHLLLTFPLLVILVAVAFATLRDHRPAVGGFLVAALLVTTGAYAVGGDLAYASQPRDQAASWIADRATANTTVETYVGDPQEAGVPRGVEIFHPSDRTMLVDGRVVSPRYSVWVRAMPERCPDYVVLNYHESILRLAPDTWGKRADVLGDEELERYVRALLAEETYPYEVAERFGRTPRFLDGGDRRSGWWRLARIGIRPRTIQYGDPQDLGIDQYTVVLERTGACDPAATSPLR